MPMKDGGLTMKLLKADSDQGFFLAKDGNYCVIDQITKEDLLRLVRSVLNDDVEFDEYDEEIIKNQAHQVVYKSIYRNLYLEDYKRYTEDASQSDA